MTHNWKIYNLEKTITDGIVLKATYGCVSEHGDMSVREIKDINFTTGSITDPSFVSYDSLTEDIVLAWVTGSIDTSIMETSNSASIANEILEESLRTTEEGIPW